MNFSGSSATRTEVQLDLARCMLGQRSFMRALQDVFSFPAYYGDNMNAMNDCMRDLGWFPAGEIVVRLVNLAKANKRSPERLAVVLAYLRWYVAHFEQFGPPGRLRLLGDPAPPDELVKAPLPGRYT